MFQLLIQHFSNLSTRELPAPLFLTADFFFCKVPSGTRASHIKPDLRPILPVTEWIKQRSFYLSCLSGMFQGQRSCRRISPISLAE